ncbi:MAG: rRNA pseudouridine synthase [Kiritimatiellae bacterium]|nr:rRNA pseudouridine synthase [Kiritimatiellia bacterium]
MSVRLQSLLSSLGVDSRRHCASLVAGGAVRVDGHVVREPGFRVENPETAVVEVDGRRVNPAPARARRTILLNKPRGVLCTREEGRGPTVYGLLRGVRERVVSAGRLDRESEGLLVLSDDGALVNRLTHPRFGHEKRYEVRACGPFGQATLDALQGPMELDGYRIRPVRVEYLRRLPDGPRGPRHALLFSLREGRNRQIRNMCEAVGLRVEALVRVAVNALRLPPDLRPGAWRDATPRELALLERAPADPLRPWSPPA